MEDEFHNYLPTVMFRGTLCIIYPKNYIMLPMWYVVKKNKSEHYEF